MEGLWNNENFSNTLSSLKYTHQYRQECSFNFEMTYTEEKECKNNNDRLPRMIYIFRLKMRKLDGPMVNEV
ncbi:hypothetical protein PV328_001732 [Microctonus aethiopoides]|uniref:Uncharacterized protein n=1 Tax=Microctonus aethiopoides TaxID=144406 RepID=A0AA39FXK8_9HYME|nr:hypothetical protein PV328_001732 [Microctonus aethiopoides]